MKPVVIIYLVHGCATLKRRDVGPCSSVAVLLRRRLPLAPTPLFEVADERKGGRVRR